MACLVFDLTFEAILTKSRLWRCLLLSTVMAEHYIQQFKLSLPCVGWLRNIDMTKLPYCWPCILERDWWQEENRNSRWKDVKTSTDWHSSKVKNSWHDWPIVLARGCTTILSFSLLFFLHLPSLSPPSFLLIRSCDVSTLQAIWCLEVPWIYLLFLCNWLKPFNGLPSIYLPNICHFIYLSSLFACLAFVTSANTVTLLSFWPLLDLPC